MARVQHVHDRLAQRAVEVSVDLGVFEEGILRDQLAETRHREKVVIEAVLLLAARRARGAGDGILHVGVLLEQHVDKS